jgi:hypothetical protein
MLGAKKSRVPGRSGNEYGNAAPAEAPAGGRSGAAPQMDSRGNATGVFAAGVEHLSVARTITETRRAARTCARKNTTAARNGASREADVFKETARPLKNQLHPVH